MTITTDSRSHVVYLDRRLVKRMLTGADARAHTTWSAGIARAAKSYATYLDRSLQVRGDTIELKGPLSWLKRMVEICGDAPAAFEIGRQLQGPE